MLALVAALAILIASMCALAEDAVWEKIETLRGLDIDISEEAAGKVAQAMAEWRDYYERSDWARESPGLLDFLDSYESLLSMLGNGAGEYDEQTWEIIPITDDVYAFDAEMITIQVGYQELLHAVTRLSGGKIDIRNLSMSIPGAVLESGYGAFYMVFQINGKPVRYKAKLRTDWMDENILDFLNEQIRAIDPENQLWAMYDGGQGAILFYRDAAWAERFQAVTGCELGGW